MPRSSANPKPHAVARIAEAIARLNVTDPDHFANALADYLFTLRPIETDASVLGQQRADLIASGAMTAEQLTRLEHELRQGALLLNETGSYVSSLLTSWSISQTAHYLDRAESDIKAAAAAQELHAFTAAGTLRFPDWQFTYDGRRLLPGIPELLSATAGWHPVTLAGFMQTPSHALAANLPQSPLSWLTATGDINAILSLVDAIKRS